MSAIAAPVVGVQVPCGHVESVAFDGYVLAFWTVSKLQGWHRTFLTMDALSPSSLSTLEGLAEGVQTKGLNSHYSY